MVIYGDIEKSQAGEKQGHQEGEYSDPCLKERIYRERISASIDNSAKVETPQGQPGEEGSQNGAGGKGGSTEHQGEHPHPDYFVD
jgi:hypothetical protein